MGNEDEKLGSDHPRSEFENLLNTGSKNIGSGYLSASDKTTSHGAPQRTSSEMTTNSKFTQPHFENPTKSPTPDTITRSEEKDTTSKPYRVVIRTSIIDD